MFEPTSNNRPGYKPAETKPDLNQSDHNAFTMPAPQTHLAEDKGKYTSVTHIHDIPHDLNLYFKQGFFFFNENKSGNIVGLNASMFVNL